MDCKRILRCLLLIVLGLSIAGLLPSVAAAENADTDDEPAENWIVLFNGKNLDGWTPKITGYKLGENFGNTFRVEDGVLKVVYDEYERFDNRFGHLFYKTPFSHYRLRVEYRFVGEQLAGGPGWAFRNSGIMLHCQDPNTMGKDQFFPVSIEAQLLGGDGQNPRPNLSVCTPGTHVVINGRLDRSHCISSNSRTFHGDQWVVAEVEVRGDEVIRHYANGELVLEYHKPQLDPNDADAKKLIQDGRTALSSGYISLQSESHPCEFRVVKILLLD